MSAQKPHKETHTKNDTILVSKAVITSWKAPPFQRPLSVNEKVRKLVGKIKDDGGVIPGVITLGRMASETYLLDGQHRCHAFLLTELDHGYADIRTLYCSSFAEMAEEFANVNSRLVNLRPDDLLRALESTNPRMQYLRKRCPFIGYGFIRRGGPSAPIVSMSSVLRCWSLSGPDTPGGGGMAASTLAETLTEDDAEVLSRFLGLCIGAWGRDVEYQRLWSNLNLTVTAWLYRRTVIAQYSPNTVRLTNESFGKCLMSLSAASDYLDWLVGRNLGERDRSPCYARLKAIFAKRIEEETGVKPRLPSPPWAHHASGRAKKI